jgi:hypothetical protein
VKPLFKIIFLCEDHVSLGRAENLRSTLIRNCAAAVHIESHFCEYARLCHPQLRQTALGHAVEADMLIISAKGTYSVPEFVQKWMDEVGALRPEKIICAEFLAIGGTPNELVFHRVIEKWAAQNSEMLFSNLFPDGRATALPNSSISMTSHPQT